MIAGDLGEGGVLFAGELFHFVEAAGELGGGFLEGKFRVDVEETGEIDEDEEEVTEFGFDARRLRRLGFRGLRRDPSLRRLRSG